MTIKHAILIPLHWFTRFFLFKYELVDEDDLTVHTWDSNIVDHLMGQLLALKWSGIRFHSMKKIPLMKKEKIQLL